MRSITSLTSRHWGLLTLCASILLVSRAPEYSVLGSYAWTTFTLFSVTVITRTVYWVILYPATFTPFKHLPTPSKRWFLSGNEKKLFAEPPGVVARRWAETLPNEGLLRYYTSANLERVLITSPKGLAEVLVHKAYDFAKTEQLKLAIARITGEGLGFVEGDEHKVQRKYLMPAFSHRHIKNLYPIFWKKGVEMVKCIETDLNKRGSAAKIAKISDWASRTTLDIIGAAGMDHDFLSLENPDNELNVQYRKMFMEPSTTLRIIALLGFFFDLRVLHKLPLPRNRELNEGTKYLRNVTRQIIQGKKKKLEKKESAGVDIISVALASGGFTEEGLVNQMMTFLAAGHETTATALCWTVYALCKHPQIQTRLRDEIRANLPPISTENPTIPDAAAVDALPYLNAVCNEVFRFYPPVPLTYREALKDSSVLGTFIPKGTVMVLAADATNHNPDLWGLDAAKFNPERWMGPGRANTGGAESNYSFLSFIHGPRSCIGQAFSKSELACLVAVLVGRFDIELQDPEAQLEVSVGITVAPKDGVLARLNVVEGW